MHNYNILQLGVISENTQLSLGMKLTDLFGAPDVGLIFKGKTIMEFTQLA